MREGDLKVHGKLKLTGARQKPAQPPAGHVFPLDNAKEMGAGGSARSPQSQLLCRILPRLINEEDLSTILDQLLVAVAEELGAHSAALWLHDPRDGTNLLYETSYQGKILNGGKQLGHPYAARREFAKTELIPHTLTQGSLVIPDVTNNPLVEPEVARWMETHGIKSLLCVPLTFGSESVGVMTIRAATEDAFGRRHEKLARLLSHPVGLAIHLMQLAGEAERCAVLEERSRIAQEIHDSLAQNLIEIVRRLDFVTCSDPSGQNTDDLRKSQLEQVQILARETLTEARRSVWDLGPAQLEGRDLVGALRLLAARHGSLARVQVSLLGKPRFLPREMQNDLFRICQEAVNNALKHSGASKVRIELAYKPGAVELKVEDDGQGFDVEEVNGRGGFGLISLRQRAARSGLQLAILSEIAGGTRIVAKLPDTQIAGKRRMA